MKKTTVLLIITALISAMLTYGLMHGSSQRSHNEEPASAESGNTRAIEIAGLKTERAVIGESWEQVVATGEVGPNVNRVVKIGPRIDGKIVRVYANVGDVVKAGQSLATMSSMELAQARAAHHQAAAKVKAARESYDRQVKLAKLGAFSSRPVEEAKSEHNSAQGDLAQAEGELARNESELAQCEARLSRAKELYKDQIVSRQDLESAEAEYKRDGVEVEVTKAKIRQAEARVAITKTYLNREEKVLGGDLLASKELQAARGDLRVAELELHAAADTIRVLGANPSDSGDTIAITSPLDGKVVSRSVNLGEMAGPSDTLFTVMNLSDVWVEADVYEKDLARIRNGQAAEIRVNSYPERVFSGKITYIGDLLDPDSRTAKIRCVVSNSTGLLKPEMFAAISIITSKRAGAVLVAKEAILDEAGKKVAFTPCLDCEEDKKAGRSVCGSYDKREVVLGAAHNGKIEVRSGIQPGEEVVTVGAYQLKTALGSGKLEAGCADEK